MKLSSLFSKYLYQEKKLRLPGIGVFTIDPSLTVPDANDKFFQEFLENIRYSQEPVAAADENFINFIRTETGKIKPLAESDLDSFISDGKILLNIGKPFHIEGIGSLQKTREGVLEFKAGEPSLHKSETNNTETEVHEKPKSFYLDTSGSGTSSRKLLIALGAIAGIVIVIWGGYILYNRNSTPVTSAVPAVPAMSDSSSLKISADSTTAIAAVPPQTSGTYKFIIERTFNKGRALRRYNQLTGDLIPIKMETPDSSLFKLYFLLPATPADTARIRDSLKNWYGRKVVYVEQ